VVAIVRCFELLAFRKIFQDICPFILIGGRRQGPWGPSLNFIFDDDGDSSPDPLSDDCGPLEFELGPEVAIPSAGFELDEETAATAASFAIAAALSTLICQQLRRSTFVKGGRHY